MDAAEFLKKIFEYAETGHTYLFYLPSQAAVSIAVGDFSNLPVRYQQNTYFSPGITAAADNHKAGNDDIIGITALWADIDIYHPAAHKAANLPRDINEAMQVLPDNIPPSMIVHSGYGLQAWWILKEAWYFDSPEEKTQAEKLLRNLQCYIRSRAQEYGWHLDAVSDLSRVMRLPDTVNYKIPEQPVWAQVIEQSELEYDPAELTDLIPEAPEIQTGAKRSVSFERRPTDKPATLMIQNCNFLQHWQLNYKSLPEPLWMAAMTNIIRGIDGENIIIDAAKNWLDDKYDHNKTVEKMQHMIAECHPQTCEYIRTELGFQGCPLDGCPGVQSPCSWSLAKLPSSLALLKSISIPTPENINNPEVLGALAIVKDNNPLEFDNFYQRYQGDKNLFRKAVSNHKKEQLGLKVVDGGGSNNPSADNNTEYLSQFVPDVPVNLVMPSNGSRFITWEFNNNGVALKKATDNGVQYQQAAYAPVIISERIFNIDTQTEKARVSFKTEFGSWRHVVVPKTTVYNARNIVQLANSGLIVTSEMAKHLVKWLAGLEAANPRAISVKQGVSKMGWRNNNTQFILPGIASNYVIDVGDIAVESTLAGLGQAGDFNAWLNTMGQLRTRTIARFIMAASFATPLLDILGQRPVTVYNYDTTRGGKTATLHAALSVWGKPSEIVKTFKDSMTNIERTAALYTDLPLGLNEYELLNEKEKAEAQTLIYQITEGRGRGRATREGLQETSQWRTICLMNGESQFTRHNSRGGVYTRMIEIKGGPLVDDDLFASNLYGFTARNYGNAGKLFIEQLLQADHNQLRDTYNKTRMAFRAAYPDKLESHIDAIACIALGDQLASMWLWEENKDQAGAQAVYMANEIIRNLITKSEADESIRAWEWLPDWLAANENRFFRGSNKSGLPWLGCVSDGYIFIIKNELIKALTDEGYSANKILSAWADANRFECGEVNGKRTFGIRGKRLNGKQPWMIAIKMDAEN